MPQFECNVCGETVAVGGKGGEEPIRGESALEHMEQTGHSPKRPQVAACNDCGNVWNYTGDADKPTCSNCRGKNTVIND